MGDWGVLGGGRPTSAWLVSKKFLTIVQLILFVITNEEQLSLSCCVSHNHMYIYAMLGVYYKKWTNVKRVGCLVFEPVDVHLSALICTSKIIFLILESDTLYYIHKGISVLMLPKIFRIRVDSLSRCKRWCSHCSYINHIYFFTQFIFVW